MNSYSVANTGADHLNRNKNKRAVLQNCYRD